MTFDETAQNYTAIIKELEGLTREGDSPDGQDMPYCAERLARLFRRYVEQVVENKELSALLGRIMDGW